MVHSSNRLPDLLVGHASLSISWAERCLDSRPHAVHSTTASPTLQTLTCNLDRTLLLSPSQVRLDSFAKFLAPGLRLGWVTAAAPLVDKLTFCIHGNSLGACATTQVSAPASRRDQGWAVVSEVRTVPGARRGARSVETCDLAGLSASGSGIQP